MLKKIFIVFTLPLLVAGTTQAAIGQALTYKSPFVISLTNTIKSWTSDFGARSAAIPANSYPATNNWYNFDYNSGYPGSYGPLDPELYSTSSSNTANTNIVQDLRYDRGPATYDVAINTPPPGVDPLTWEQQRLLAAASSLIGTHYQHIHLPSFNAAKVPTNDYTWSGVSTNQFLQTSRELIFGNTSTVINPYAATYGIATNGIDCTDFSSYIYNLALGIQMYSGTATQVEFTNSAGTPVLLGTNAIPTATILANDGSVITPNFIESPNFGTGLLNGPGSLNSVIAQLRPGDLLYMWGAPTNISHVVVWLGTYGSTVNGKPSTVPLIISSHDNTPAIFNTTNINSVTGLPNGLTSNNTTTFLPPPGVQILPFTPDTWFYQNFSVAMQVLPLPYPANYGISKVINYDQSGSAVPTLDPSQPYQFQSFVNPGTNGNLLSTSTLTPPAKSSTGNVAFQSGPNGLWFGENFPNKTALDAAFPAGAYSFVIQTTQPNTFISQTLLGSDHYPSPVPKITGATNASWSGGYLNVPNTQNPVTFVWPSYKATNGYISLNIQGENGFNTNFPATGTNTSYTIPGRTLPESSVIQVTLGFSASSGENSNASYQVQNSFFITTGPSNPASNSPTLIQKQNVLVQTSINAPVGGSGNINGDPAPYNFSIQNPVAAKVKGPSGTYTLAFSTGDNAVSYSYLSAPFATINKLNASYKDGTYKVSPSQVVQLTNSVYPNATNPPEVTLVNGTTPLWNAQGQLLLDPSIDNTLTWTAFSGTNSSFIFATGGYEQFQIQNNNGGFSTNAEAGIRGNNAPAFNTFTIPANSLSINQTYIGSINYFLASSLSITNGLVGAGYSTETYFTILATPTP